jgi:hypothetical protein
LTFDDENGIFIHRSNVPIPTKDERKAFEEAYRMQVLDARSQHEQNTKSTNKNDKTMNIAERIDDELGQERKFAVDRPTYLILNNSTRAKLLRISRHGHGTQVEVDHKTGALTYRGLHIAIVEQNGDSEFFDIA